MVVSISVQILTKTKNIVDTMWKSQKHMVQDWMMAVGTVW